MSCSVQSTQFSVRARRCSQRWSSRQSVTDAAVIAGDVPAERGGGEETAGTRCTDRGAFTEKVACDQGLKARSGGSHVEREVRVQVE